MEKIVVYVKKNQHNHWENYWQTEEAYIAIGLNKAEMEEVMLSLSEQYSNEDYRNGITISGLFVDPSTQNWVEFKFDSSRMVEEMEEDEDEVEVNDEIIDKYVVDNLLNEGGGSYGDVLELSLVNPDEFDDEDNDLYEENNKMGELIMQPISMAQKLNDAGIKTKSASIENACIIVTDSVSVSFDEEGLVCVKTLNASASEEVMEARTNTDWCGIVSDIQSALHLNNVATCKVNPVAKSQENEYSF